MLRSVRLSQAVWISLSRPNDRIWICTIENVNSLFDLLLTSVDSNFTQTLNANMFIHPHESCLLFFVQKPKMKQQQFSLCQTNSRPLFHELFLIAVHSHGPRSVCAGARLFCRERAAVMPQLAASVGGAKQRKKYRLRKIASGWGGSAYAEEETGMWCTARGQATVSLRRRDNRRGVHAAVSGLSVHTTGHSFNLTLHSFWGCWKYRVATFFRLPNQNRSSLTENDEWRGALNASRKGKKGFVYHSQSQINCSSDHSTHNKATLKLTSTGGVLKYEQTRK